jgi:hypothetical protein
MTSTVFSRRSSSFIVLSQWLYSVLILISPSMVFALASSVQVQVPESLRSSPLSSHERSMSNVFQKPVEVLPLTAKIFNLPLFFVLLHDSILFLEKRRVISPKSYLIYEGSRKLLAIVVLLATVVPFLMYSLRQ